MLSQDDRRRLETIASHLEIEDPDLAQALRDGRPRSWLSQRSWPFAVGAVLAGVVFMLGVLTAAITVMLLGAAVFGYSLTMLWFRLCRSRGPRMRPSRRRR